MADITYGFVCGWCVWGEDVEYGIIQPSANIAHSQARQICRDSRYPVYSWVIFITSVEGVGVTNLESLYKGRGGVVTVMFDRESWNEGTDEL